jgi:NADPH-dependent ferric siderophore reductase
MVIGGRGTAPALARLLKELETENTRLKRLLAETMLETRSPRKRFEASALRALAFVRAG